MRVLTKICGVSTPDALAAAVEGGASHIGLNFFPPSPRCVTMDRAAELAALVPPSVQLVGVFVDPDDALVDQAVNAGELEGIQLHETAPERVAHLRRSCGVEAWAAVAVRTRDDLEGARAFLGAADRVLYDARTPPGTLPGGMGVRFDWDLLDGFQHRLSWALSGGLDPDNVAGAIRRTGAPLVDVSSGVEDEPGVKSPARIAAFLRAVAAA